MRLGAFSVSLKVKDIGISKAFYQQLGFVVYAGEEQQNWLIMKNADHCIGLFQGMLEENLLTFNPGWDKDCNPLPEFSDIRELHAQFTKAGLEISNQSLSSQSGPGSFSITDPDGNLILLDQHL